MAAKGGGEIDLEQIAAAPIADDRGWLCFVLARVLHWLRRDFCTASVAVVLRRANGLHNTDVGGKSDPYAILHVGHHQHRSKTISNDLNPVWNETITL